LSADEDDEESVFEDRRAARAEKVVGDFPVFRGIALPDFFAGFEMQAEQFALRAERIAAVFGEQRRAAGAVVIAVGVGEIGVVLVFPDGFTGDGVEAFDNVFVFQTVVNDEAFAEDGGGAVTGADALFPEDRRAGFGPFVEQIGFPGNAGAERAEKDRPIIAGAIVGA